LPSSNYGSLGSSSTHPILDLTLTIIDSLSLNFVKENVTVMRERITYKINYILS